MQGAETPHPVPSPQLQVFILDEVVAAAGGRLRSRTLSRIDRREGRGILVSEMSCMSSWASDQGKEHLGEMVSERSISGGSACFGPVGALPVSVACRSEAQRKCHFVGGAVEIA